MSLAAAASGCASCRRRNATTARNYPPRTTGGGRRRSAPTSPKRTRAGRTSHPEAGARTPHAQVGCTLRVGIDRALRVICVRSTCATPASAHVLSVCYEKMGTRDKMRLNLLVTRSVEVVVVVVVVCCLVATPLPHTLLSVIRPRAPRPPLASLAPSAAQSPTALRSVKQSGPRRAESGEINSKSIAMVSHSTVLK